MASYKGNFNEFLSKEVKRLQGTDVDTDKKEIKRLRCKIQEKVKEDGKNKYVTRKNV